jgi:Short C-terminal domain
LGWVFGSQKDVYFLFTLDYNSLFRSRYPLPVEIIPIVLFGLSCPVILFASLIGLFKNTSPVNIADELLKLDGLQVKGIITAEEFERQKKKLLS